jgi:hypothetical protein
MSDFGTSTLANFVPELAFAEGATMLCLPMRPVAIYRATCRHAG